MLMKYILMLKLACLMHVNKFFFDDDDDEMSRRAGAEIPTRFI